MAYGYAAQNVDPEVTSKASGRDVPVKPKHGVNIARAIKGMKAEKAEKYLEEVIALERSIPFKTNKRHVKHRADISGPGQYPVAAATAFLKVLRDAKANAEYKGLEPEAMFVWHAVAHRGSPLPGFMPRAQGRATQWNKATSHIEIVLSEHAEAGEAVDAAAKAEKKAKRERDQERRAKAGRATVKKTPSKKKKEE